MKMLFASLLVLVCLAACAKNKDDSKPNGSADSPNEGVLQVSSDAQNLDSNTVVFAPVTSGMNLTKSLVFKAPYDGVLMTQNISPVPAIAWDCANEADDQTKTVTDIRMRDENGSFTVEAKGVPGSGFETEYSLKAGQEIAVTVQLISKTSCSSISVIGPQAAFVRN